MMFSVVIPLYNKEESIQNTIYSVLNQIEIEQNFEIIVVNDGSTDQSVERVAEIDDPRIRIINKTNGGVSSARNKGIEEAKNEWIAFLDGDDLWENNHLSEIKRMMKLYPDKKIYVTSFKYSDSRFIYKYERDNEVFEIDNYFKEAIKEPLIWTSIVVIHNSCFKDIGKFNIKLSRGEDLDLWGRFARKHKIIKSSRITAVYKIDAENRSDKTFDLFKSRVYHYDFQDAISEDEINYNKKYVISVLKMYLLHWNLRMFLVLYKKHKRYVSLIDVFSS